MDRSARSGKQNIVEGWKRNTTKEYYDFLGFSIGAIAELEEDCNDVWKGIYFDLMGIKGIMGEMGTKGIEKGEMGKEREMERREMGNPLTPSNPLNPSPSNPINLSLSTPFKPFDPPFDIEKLRFYPLDENLPPIVKLKLQCRELNFMLHRLQESLLSKMDQEKTLPTKDKIKIANDQNRQGDIEYKKMLDKMGLKMLENGRVIKKYKSVE